jgi:RNA polymerase sigma-70 factor (ECF subfamily)
MRSPVSVGMPSSGSMPPASEQDIEGDMDRRKVGQHIFPQLSREHQKVLTAVVVNRLTLKDAAALLEIPEGTLKSRLIAAKAAFNALAEPFLEQNQKGLT